jgi:hypothetical protein
MLSVFARANAVCGTLERSMPDQPRHWRRIYERAKLATSPQEKRKLCQQARRLMQRRLVEIGAGAADAKEQAAIEAALRDLWLMEEEVV